MSHRTNIARLKLGGWINALERGPAEAAPREGAPQKLLANRYRVKSLLGQGGMGRVLLADDLSENREVALKILLSPQRDADKATLDVGFRQEFYTLTKLRHPGTVQVFDFGKLENGERYLSMELVRGADLRELIHKGPVPFKTVTSVLADLAQVLGFIHSRLFVHCDIKAENIRVSTKGTTKLMDFGLMFPMGNPSGSTLRGTPSYMAPEVARGGVIDARTDLYSLGVLAFELVTGRLPFTGASLAELISEHLSKPPPRPSQIREDVPPKLEELISRCLAKAPAERFEDAGAFLQALSAATGRPIEVQSVPQRTSYLNSAELIGRGAEMKQLDDAFAGLASGAGCSLLLGAPAGAGKTRLLQEFLLKVRLADVPSVLGQCRREGLTPLRPIMQALAGLLGRSTPELLARVAPPLVSAMPELARQGFKPRVFQDAVQEKAAILEAVVTWVREVSQKAPLVIVLEDLHWADAATLELLTALNRQVRQMRVLALGTFRSEEVDRMGLLFNGVDAGDTTLMELPPLAREDLGTMVAMMLRGSALPPEFLDSLHRVTKGNCFFATESLRALLEAGSVRQEAGKWAVTGEALALPQTIAEVVVRRLATLEPELLAFGTVAAAAGRVLDLGLLEHVSGTSGEKLFGLIDEMVERQFVTRVDEQVLFTHETVRDSILRRLEPKERATLHRRIGERLEADPARLDERAAILAHHFSHSDDSTRAVRYLLLAGQQALKVRALTDASRMLIQATNLLASIEYPDKDSEQLAAWASIIDCTFATTPLVAVEYADRLARHYRKVVDVERASRLMRRMMSVVNRLPAPLRRGIKRKIYADHPFDARTRVPFVVLPQLLQYLTLKAFAHGFLNQWQDTFRELDVCQALNPDGESIFMAGTHAIRSLMFGLKGEVRSSTLAAAECFAIAERNLETVSTHVTRQIYGNCILLGPIGDSFNAAVVDPARIERAIEVATQHDLLELVFQARWPVHVRACQTGDAGAWQRARTELLDVVRRLGYPPFHESRLYYWDPLFHLEQGRLDEGLAAVARLERLGAQVQDRASVAQACAFRATAALAQRDFATAQQQIDRSLAISREHELATFGRWAPLKAEVLLQRGERAAAIAWLEADVLPSALSPERGAPITQTLACRVYGEALGGEAGTAQALKALEIARTHSIVVQEGFAHFALARLALATDRSKASGHLDDAAEAFTRAGNPYQLAQLKAFRGRVAMGAAS